MKNKNHGSKPSPLTLNKPIEGHRALRASGHGSALFDEDGRDVLAGPMAGEMKDAISRTFDWLARHRGGCLTVRQVATVLELSRMGDVDFGTTADRIGISRSALSRIIDRLVDDGLVLRRTQATDRRRVVLSITTQGAELADGILRGGEQKELVLGPPSMGLLDAMDDTDLERSSLLLSGTLSFSQTSPSPGSERRRLRTR